MNDEYVVIINEGEKTEKQIIDNIEEVFFGRTIPDNIKILSFKSNIYSLWNTWKKDDFETDVLELLIEKDSEVKQQISSIKKKISQIYLFFDYDGHDSAADDSIVKEMLEKFDNETDNGKIYISYPMVEAIKDLQMKSSCVGRCTVKAKENIRYKGMVAKDTICCDLTSLSRSHWEIILGHGIRKANCIINDCYKIPEYNIYMDDMGQENIFQKQCEKYISSQELVAVLSAFPFFLIDYFGEDFYNEIQNKQGQFDALPKVSCERIQIRENESGQEIVTE